MIIKDEYDVIVVGAGPAGSSTALTIARRGLNVLIVDRNQELGCPKRCGEGFGDYALNQIGLKRNEKWVDQYINGALLYAPNGKEIVMDYGKDVGYIIDRKKFDKWLALEACKAGAQIQTKTIVDDIIKENDFVKGIHAKFLSEHFDIRAKVVVAADGAESTIAKKAGMKIPSSPNFFDSGFQYEMAGIDLEDKKKLEFYFGQKIAPGGYIWIFPKGEDRANVGIGISAKNSKTAKAYLDKFIKTNRKFERGSIIEVNGGAIPLGGIIPDMVMNGLLVVGDAAHQINPLHGGGLAESIIAGKIAGTVISDAIAKNDVSRRGLSNYNRVWWKERGNKLKNLEKAKTLFEKLSDRQLNTLANELDKKKIEEITSGNLSKLMKLISKLAMVGIKEKLGF